METAPSPGFAGPGPHAGAGGLRSRLRAAGIHLGLSAAVAGLCAAVVLGIWYPQPFREISGGKGLFLLMVSVDLVLGPLVTLAVFDRRKPWRELRRDLAIVGLLQLTGLAYGLYTVWEARPVYLVFEVDRFRVVRAIDIDDADLQQAPQGLQTLPRFGPGIIMAQPPTDRSDVVKSIERAMAGRDIFVQPKTWRPYADALSAVRRRAKPLADLDRAQPAHHAAIEAAVRAAGLPVERIAYLPIIAKQANWVALVYNQDARVVGYLPFGGFA